VIEMPLGDFFEKSRRKAISMDILKSRKLVKPGVEYKKPISPHIRAKRMVVKHGKVVLKPTRRGVSYSKSIKDAIEAGKRSRIFFIQLSEAGKGMEFIDQNLYQDLIRALLSMYNKIRMFIRTKHLYRVPINTGKLRRSLMRSLGEHYISIKNEQRLLMELGSNLPYLPIVNEMPTNVEGGSGPHLRHPPYIKKGGGITTEKEKASYVPGEDDVLAVHHFFDFIVAESRKGAKAIMESVISKVYIEHKQTMGWTHRSHARRLFTIVE
jgi:hypothetical protein